MPDRAPSTPPLKITPTVFHVLLCLADGRAHAYGIMKELQSRPSGSISIGPGSLHFTLGRLYDAEMIIEAPEDPAAAGAGARRKYYALSPYGRSVLEAEARALEEVVDLARGKRLIPQREGS